jgi:hypothetical protein
MKRVRKLRADAQRRREEVPTTHPDTKLLALKQYGGVAFLQRIIRRMPWLLCPHDLVWCRLTVVVWCRQSAAIRVQLCYRSRLARKKAHRLRVERRKKLEEGEEAACLLGTGSKRDRSINLPRDPCSTDVTLLHRNTTGDHTRGRHDSLTPPTAPPPAVAAVRIQSAFRRHAAKKRVAVLRAERRRKLEEGAALRIQSAYRCRLAKKKVGGSQTSFERAWRGKRLSGPCVVPGLSQGQAMKGWPTNSLRC